MARGHASGSEDDQWRYSFNVDEDDLYIYMHVRVYNIYIYIMYIDDFFPLPA